MKRREWFLVVLTTALVSCTTLPPLDTPSGRPEIFINGVVKSEALNTVVALASTRGFFVAQQTNFSLLLTRESENFLVDALLGSRFNRVPQYQLRINAVDIDDGVQLSASMAIVSNPGSAFASSTGVSKSGRAAHDLQTFLEQVKQKLIAVETKVNPGIGATPNGIE